MGRIYDYKVNYSKYLELRKEHREQQQKAYDEQQKMIAETEQFIERFKGTYSKTLQVQSRVKMLEKLELLVVDEIVRRKTGVFGCHFLDSSRRQNCFCGEKQRW